MFSRKLCSELLLLVAATQQGLPATGFVISPCNNEYHCRSSTVSSSTHGHQRNNKHLVPLNAEADAWEGQTNGSYDPKQVFPVADYEEFSLLPHRPLGMTIEESLADGKLVLVTKVVEGGHASQAGIEVGDVLVGVTGLFGDVTNVIGEEVDKIKGMVGSRPDDEPLEIKVARGTGAYDEHEKAVIDLCANESTDKEIEECVVDYLSMDYNDLNGLTKENNNGDDECEVDDPDGDCLVDNLMGMWAEDLPPPPPSASEQLPSEDKKDAAPAVKPWSSRSSPSGTYVRDPATGKMKNIG